MKKSNKNLTAKEKGQLFAEQIAKRFLSVLSYNGPAWVKEWRGPSMAPINGVSKKKYRGVNQFILALVAMSCGYKEESRDPAEFFLKARYFTVFNAEQVEGVDPYVADLQVFDTHPNETVIELAQKMGVNISYDGGDRAFYRPSDDTVHLPKAEHFFSSVAWAGTTLHKLGHASGAEKRMNRVGIVKKGIGMFDEKYAYEELIAEIISCLMCYNLGIEESEENINNHEAYVASWVEEIQNKPDSLLNAVKEAQKASDYMMGLLGDCESPPDDESEVILDVA